MVRRVIPAEIDRRVREAARHRCGYCLSPQRLVMARLEVEHTIPLAKGGTDDETNLWLACPICNGHKSDKTMALDPDTRTTVPLFNPRIDLWSDHFEWNGATLLGKTPCGQVTIEVLAINLPYRITLRAALIAEGIFPPIAS